MFRPAIAVLLLAGCGSPAPAPTTTTTATTTMLETPPPPPDAAPRATFAVTRDAPLALDDGQQVQVLQIVTEAIAAHGDYPGGSGVTVTLEVDGHEAQVDRLPEGYPSKAIAWFEELRIELVDSDGTSATLAIDRVTDRVVDTAAIRIQRGETVTLFGDVTFTFTGHSHKSVGPGQESPLMVNVDYHDGAAYGWTHHLYPPRQPSWTWRDLRFTLVEHHYDDFMELTVERRALEPAAASSP